MVNIVIEVSKYILHTQLFNILQELELCLSCPMLKSAGKSFVWMSTCNMQFGKIADMRLIMESNFIWPYHHR
jgi:hypothetical protein